MLDDPKDKDKTEDAKIRVNSEQKQTTVQQILSFWQLKLWTSIKQLSKTDYLVQKMYSKEITEQDVQKINTFMDAFWDYLIKTQAINEENFKNFLIVYAKKHPLDYKSIIVGVKIIRSEFDKKFWKSNDTSLALHKFITNGSKILDEVLNELFKPSKARWALYTVIWINRDRIGYDNKLKNNESYKIIMKWVIDEIMSIGPVIDYFTQEPLECTKAFVDMMRPLDNFINTIDGVVGSYTKMFHSDSNTPEWLYEIWKWLTQRITTLIPAGSLKTILTNSLKTIVSKAAIRTAKIAWMWPWLRANTKDIK